MTAGTADTPIGFIGLGRMGLPMAQRLATAGHRLLAFDQNPQSRAALAAAGVDWAAAVADVAARCHTVLVSLPTPAIVEQVLCGPAGLSAAGKVRCIVDLSTTGPAMTEALAQRLRQRDIELIDAPVSGGPTGAAAGTLTIMCSGAPAALTEVKPLLDVLGSQVFDLGPVAGRGQLMKVINNTLCAVSALASFEGLVLGTKGGLDPATMLRVLNASSGRSFATEVKIPQCVLDRSFPQRFSTELLHKDVRLCLDQAEQLGVTMWMGELARQWLAFGISQGDGPRDYGHLIERLEGWAGVQVGQVPTDPSPSSTETAP
ncbi:MAG: NAD(P)-dependent oxidoreductase [Lysobacterales bacterium]